MEKARGGTARLMPEHGMEHPSCDACALCLMLAAGGPRSLVSAVCLLLIALPSRWGARTLVVACGDPFQAHEVKETLLGKAEEARAGFASLRGCCAGLLGAGAAHDASHHHLTCSRLPLRNAGGPLLGRGARPQRGRRGRGQRPRRCGHRSRQGARRLTTRGGCCCCGISPAAARY